MPLSCAAGDGPGSNASVGGDGAGGSRGGGTGGEACARPVLSAVVIIFSAVTDVDSSALRMLQGLLTELRARGLRLLLAGCVGPVRDAFERAGFLEEIGRNKVFAQVNVEV